MLGDITMNDNINIFHAKVKQKHAQLFLDLIEKHIDINRVLASKYKVLKDGDHVYFPLKESSTTIEFLNTKIKKKVEFDVVKKPAKMNKNYQRSITEILQEKLPPNILEFIPKSYDTIGNTVIVEFDRLNYLSDPELSLYKSKIGEAISEVNRNIKSVYEKRSEIKGDFRLRDISLIHGIDQPELIHKENHCVFKLNLKTTYFTPRLVFEHKRISTVDIKVKEIIVDLFAGVGPISIQIARIHDVIIYAFDINPEAIRYLNTNISLNTLRGKIHSYNINVKKLLDPLNQVGKALKNQVDRVIMNLPERSHEFLEIALFLLKASGGILHFYQFSEKPDPIEKAIKSLVESLRSKNWAVRKIFESKIVKTFSPQQDLVVIDANIYRNGW